jgi:LmbE family N-acetylglucosaminyl deacetylase
MRVLLIVAHPDDAEFSAGGTLRLYSRAGHEVRVISVTNGSAGHQTLRGPQLVERRKKEFLASAQVGDFKAQVLNNHDAQLVPTLQLRDDLIGLIRNFNPDILFTHRPFDYHPDHRTVGTLVQDAAYLLTVPAVLPRASALERVPVIMFFEDMFTRPLPFEADVVVGIDATLEDKVAMLDCHVSQVYEWLPYNERRLDQAPREADARKAWLGESVRARAKTSAKHHRAMLKSLYGAKDGKTIKHAEAFEVCEYGTPLPAKRRDELFPFFRPPDVLIPSSGEPAIASGSPRTR